MLKQVQHDMTLEMNGNAILFILQIEGLWF